MKKDSAVTNQFLCKLSDLEDLSCKGFTVDVKQNSSRIFIIRKGDEVFAYLNVCPHALAPLEWNPDDFLDEKKEHIICAMHAAKFTIEEGVCIEGPCKGDGLTPVDISVSNGLIYLD
ncbi:Rieske (2Fe-2S) protein [Cocleimonas sp. KMM 6892]|jgi:nitrite reductase/ring-hydroxylating ferredoxin subunit|uniref:Rieske (2Fe-2S) protein n=1 Tax=unclassified Cocleimonas TaxID=2639732 RepID=UPI002DB6E840|nr:MULTISPECIES: Rieske (2Fe-2S) protein [unclassified Cocleimonas]MEB8433422.1 Rieske (2Fe-2S) protein [Cocleimonas sp. KMM 6892]MEC4716233.1 Rieske (2Fe-2S) protein [Cocleimonas sp. KMM 6895]MEC4745874.1 Rieske (2Fe-2S) protein [Cocleimonas sp. KMM 6896]